MATASVEKSKQTKYIFITGGVVSSLGKGISSSSLALLLKQRGYTVSMMKFDPYINVDPGTMSPLQHGEVYVTDDGTETDLDLGHYERFIGRSLSHRNNTTTGQVYETVIQMEREGKFLGKTVQVIPHITNEIKRRMMTFDGEVDIVMIEIGGTVGDIESLPFLETARQITYALGSRNVLHILLTYVPFIKAAGELKTKPTQHSVKTLMQYGIRPDVLICRTETKNPMPKEERDKIALFCNVEENAVIEGRNCEDTIYEVPLNYAKAKMDEIVLTKLGLPLNTLDLKTWKSFVNKIKKPKYEVNIGLVGKYTKFEESYKSIFEAFVHAGSINNARVHVHLINSEELNAEDVAQELTGVDGILIGPGFGVRGIEGKIAATHYTRENNIPTFGICLGMQVMVIEYARNVCGLPDANSGEFDKTSKNLVIDLMPEQRNITTKGGTMRLGSYPCKIKKDSLAYRAYGETDIAERHRHRYELNNDYRKMLEDKGMLMSGESPDGHLVEIAELPGKSWYLGCQFHPELKSRAVTGHPLFTDFIKTVLSEKLKKGKAEFSE